MQVTVFKNTKGSQVNALTGAESETSWGPSELTHNNYGISHEGVWAIGKSKIKCLL